MRSIAPSKKGYTMPEVTVRFPPEITPMNLIEKAIAKLKTNEQASRIPNAFIAYRMAFCKELHLIRHPVITQPQLSALAKQSWLNEEEHVRREYQRIAKEAKDLYIKICQERKPFFITSEYQNKSSFNDDHNPSNTKDDNSSSNTKNDIGTIEFVFSNLSNLSDSNFDLFDDNEISLLPSSSKQPVTKEKQSDSHENISASTTPNVTNILDTDFQNITNIFNTDSPIIKADNYFSLDFNLDTQLIDNLTPELLTSQALFSSILSIQSDFPSVPNLDNSNSNSNTTAVIANNNVESSIVSDNTLSSAEYNKCCKEKIGVLENRVSKLEKKIESLTDFKTPNKINDIMSEPTKKIEMMPKSNLKH
ncbi:6048_t:CDS:2 [Ambispora gerdemannii]|uniref:6048_t:CDS:1 n=1 Tax=Ambispora gerdemannii TaxID=144530 RepID=A0A9N9AGG8_9GLOM|nr:6048_t:CDS:2 [Ambispora gerdemannii]